MNEQHICISGAGLTGSLMSVFLARKGYKVSVFEKREDFRKVYSNKRRTVAMTISARGWRALGTAGVEEYIKETVIPTYGRSVHKSDRTMTIQHYGNDQHAIHSVERRELNCRLINSAEAAGDVTFYFNHELQDIDTENNKLLFVDLSSGKQQDIAFDRLIGADGLFSNVREILESRSLIEASMTEAEMGYKELTIPAKEKEHYFDQRFLHLWSSPDSIFVALPNHDKTITSTFFNANTGNDSFGEITTPEAITSFFEKKFPELIEIIPDLIEQYQNKPHSKIFTVNCERWNFENKILIMGDAAHAFPPFYAMGMNTCFEDCYVFDQLLTDFEGDFDKVFEEYTRIRKPDTDAMKELSLKNYKSLTKTEDNGYDKIWKLEREIWQKYPNTFTPEYVMVAFETKVPIHKINELSTKRSELIRKYIDKGLSGINEEDPLLQQLLTDLKQLDSIYYTV